MQTIERGSIKDRSRHAVRQRDGFKITDLLAGDQSNIDSTTLRQAQVWGEALARSIETWRHIQGRRNDGCSIDIAARKIAAERGVSMEYARMAVRLLNGGRRG